MRSDPAICRVGSALLDAGVVVQAHAVERHTLRLNLHPEALFDALSGGAYGDRIRPVAEAAGLEIDSGCHVGIETLRAEMQAVRCYLAALAGSLGLMICGGGHPLPERRDDDPCRTPPPFGLRIQLGCPDADLAGYLCQALQHYLPQFIALSAASPFHAGTDTEFASYRSHRIEACRGRCADIRWLSQVRRIEIRLCDSPLNLDTAVDLAAYAQTLSRYLLAEVPEALSPVDVFDGQQARLQAARFGFDGLSATHDDGTTIGEDILNTIELLRQNPLAAASADALRQVEQTVLSRRNDAESLRQHWRRDRDMTAVVARTALTWASARQDPVGR